MQVLWSRDEASVTDVQRAMTGRRLALTTVATMLVRLEQRGLVSHRAEGRQYIYRSRVSPADVRETVTRELLRNLFDGDVTAFVTQLLDSRQLEVLKVVRVVNKTLGIGLVVPHTNLDFMIWKHCHTSI